MFMFDCFSLIFVFLVLVISVLVGVAFLTLLERKVLGYIQIRKGPNKVGYIGILQPFGDAVKLFTKEQTFPIFSNFFLYLFSPIFNLFFSLMLWICIPSLFYFFSFNLGLLFMVCVSSLSVYSLMISGWSSNSNYSLLGGLRAMAQSISYEVSMVLIILSFLLLLNFLDLGYFFCMQKYLWMGVFTFPLFLILLVSLLAETNRTPFDFAEGESELVSGFNVEYSSGSFALIFLSEYSSIIFMSFFISLISLGGDYMSILFFLKVVFMSFFWVWVRGTLPRYRYDKLMGLAWKIYLPVSLNFMLFYLGFRVLNFSMFL
uniref:NADH-ubiquinone oxidoreductase chain 1 n=1 Tax=Dinoderus minutus TaxID=1587246 RepID=A0A343C1C4_9COLE|nr:NADH dehydrogenase subunit 1 [Dinoderus minutus]